jgi:zinc protease
MTARDVAIVAAGIAIGPLTASAQVTPRPRDMDLPTPVSPRPDPGKHRIELPGGLVAYVAEDASAPVVTLTAFVGVGSVDGPEGAAELVAHGLRTRGPAGMAPGAFRRSLRDMVADYAVVLGPESTEIVLDVPAEDAWKALGLLADLIRRGPRLGEEDLEALRSPGSAYEPPMASAAALLRGQVLGATQYGHDPNPSELAALTVDDARAFHERYFVTGNVVIAAAGPLERARLTRALTEDFGDMRAGPSNRRAITPTPRPTTERQIFTYPADKLQGWMVIGHELPVVPIEDRAPLEVMNYILGGGHFDTRLFRETRDSRGLTNDDSGILEPSRDGPGMYAFHTSGRPETVRLLLDITLDQIERIRTEPVSEEELFVAKGALADGVFAAGYRDGWATARTLAEEWLRDGSHDASAGYQERIRSVTREDVLAAARKYLHPERMQAVLIGPLEKIEAAAPMEGEGALAEYGRVIRSGRVGR